MIASLIGLLLAASEVPVRVVPKSRLLVLRWSAASRMRCKFSLPQHPSNVSVGSTRRLA